MREPRPNRRSWDRRRRISQLIHEALLLANEEAHADHLDRHVVAFLVRLGLLHEDAVELEEIALVDRHRHDRDRSD